MRPPILRGFSALPGDLVVDLFAGGGGASTGIEAALGRPVDFAINHSPEAIAVHRENHPETRHFCEDIFTVDPRDVAAGRPIGLLWASPECTNHSRAKGGKPRDDQSRTTASVILRWAALPAPLKPKIIFVENVREWLKWGPLDAKGHPIKEREGEDFRAWLASLAECGFRVDHTKLIAADFGAPTTRDRLYLLARSDGGSLAFPEATHGVQRDRPWREAAEVIDFSLPCPSIFLSTAEGRALRIRRPLAEATERRIATGIRRFILESPTPFIVPAPHGGIVAHTLAQTGYGEREGQAPRAMDIRRPLTTVVTGGKHGLVAAFLTKHYGGPNGHPTPGADMRRPLDTVTVKDHHALSVACLAKFYGTSTAVSVGDPLPTVTATGNHLAEVRAFLVKYYGNSAAESLTDPLDTVTTKDRFGLVMVRGELYRIEDIGMRMLRPHELFAAQGFPDWYSIAPDFHGSPLSAAAQTKLAGNSVCPPVAERLVREALGMNGTRAAAPGQMSLFERRAA